MRLCYNIFYAIKSPNNNDNKKKNQTPSTEQTFFYLFLVLLPSFCNFARTIFFCCRIPIDAVGGQQKVLKSINTAPNLTMNLFIIFSFSLLEKAHTIFVSN